MSLEARIWAGGGTEKEKKEEKEKVSHMCESIGHRPLRGRCPKSRVRYIYRSPKGNMWSAIPVALLCMVVNRSEWKQGSGPEGDEVL